MFSSAKCGHCGKIGTKSEEISPTGSNFKQIAIACSHCSSILGVVGYYDTGNIGNQINSKVDAISSRLDDLEALVRRIANSIR